MNEGSRTDVCPPPGKDRSEMSERELMLEILEGLDLVRGWQRRATDLLVIQGRALEGILRKRGESDEAEELRVSRINLYPPFTNEDADATTPSGYPPGAQ